MSGTFTADFEKRFPGGPRIRGRLTAPAGTFSVTVLFGPSGSGKTTVLRAVAGLERPDWGLIRFADETWFDAERRISLTPQQRKVGYLSQDYALFPHLTVGDNIAYALGGLPEGGRSRRVAELVQMLGLEGLEGRYPRQLSGGQQQRVALARTVARRPRVLLLDEPLSALDSPLRAELRGELRRWLAAAGVPAVVVTHDRVEALALGDVVVVMHEGVVHQSGPADEVFARPATPEAARVVGVETVLPATVTGASAGLTEVDLGGRRLLAEREAPAGAVFVAIRAEDVVLANEDRAPPGPWNSLRGVVVSIS